MATDPVCGMEVDESSALSETYEGETYYFCCENCREQFLLDMDPLELEAESE